MVTMKLQGLRELEGTLRELPRATGVRTVRKVGLDALAPMVADMKARAPVRFGDLVGGITAGTKLSRSQRKFAGFMGGAKIPEMVVVHAGPGPQPQAVIQEIGSFKEAAQPYVAPAWEAGKAALVDRVATGLAEPIMTAARRAARKRARLGG